MADKDKGRHWKRWQKELAPPSQLFYKFPFLPDLSTMLHLPALSFVLRIPFRLQKPYISKDECDFHLLDNPLRKEKVFQTPMVVATSWKGALRAALWHLGYKEDNEVTIRLLGNPRGGDEHQAGRLYFFPTFFDKIGLEVINPHDRQTGVGARGPIFMECVPQRTAGEFVLLYVPFGPIEQGEDERRTEVAEDLQVLAKGIRAMLTTYGFGAKTSSGFGMAEDQLAGKGKLALRVKLAGEGAPAVAPPEPQPPDLPRYLESPTRLIPDLRREDGTLKSEEEYRLWIERQGKQYKKKDRQLYEKAKNWWEKEGRVHWESGGPSSERNPLWNRSNLKRPQ
jgi:CRISPR-associated protein Cmr2